MKLQIPEKFRNSKGRWGENPRHHGNEEIPPPPAKNSCVNRARNYIARTAAQIRTGHWRSAVYFSRIRKRRDESCWFCEGKARKTRSHALFHCPNASLAAARVEAWEGWNPRSIGVLLSSPRWEGRLLRHLQLSGVGRLVEGGIEEDKAHASSQDGQVNSLGGGGGGGEAEPGPVKPHQPPPYFRFFFAFFPL
jgi:hypothetical protein